MGLSSAMSSLRRSLPSPRCRSRWRLVARDEGEQGREQGGSREGGGHSAGHCLGVHSSQHEAQGSGTRQRDVLSSMSLLC